jgi:sugar-specific transcriptional regulator TrmB
MTDDSDAAAAAALGELGLSTYAARTFVGLQKLGVATASEVADVTEVPRSQVYGATDELEAVGLVDTQQGSPRRYRPVSVDAARDLLYERLRSTADDAADHLEAVRGECEHRDDTQEAIWTTEGRTNITARITDLVSHADNRVLFVTGQRRFVEGPVATALTEADADGVSVTVASADAATLDAAAETGLDVTRVVDESAPGIDVGRVLVADDDTVALSVLPTAGLPHVETEAALWSEGTGFATILAGLVDNQID